MRVNDIVLLQDDSAFRAEWRLARVTEVYPDRRGNVRLGTSIQGVLDRFHGEQTDR